jgi:hypothetical protein
MSKKIPFRIGEFVYCESPDGACKLPFGLPRGAVVEVISAQIDTTYVLYHGRSFTILTACLHPYQRSRQPVGLDYLIGQVSTIAA